jgi:hypothetical protein
MSRKSFLLFIILFITVALFSNSEAQPLNLRHLSTSLVSGNYYKVEFSQNYAFIATLYGFKILDISNPHSQVEIAHIPTEGLTCFVRPYGDFLFTCDELGGISVYDISDIENPLFLDLINTPGSARALCVYQDYLYVATGTFGVQIVDYSDPTDLELVGVVNCGGDANDVEVFSHYLYIAKGTVGLSVYNIIDPEEPQSLYTWNTFGGNARSAVITPEGDFLILADMENGAHILSLASPSTPNLVASIQIPGESAGDVSGNEGANVVSFLNSGIRTFNNAGAILDSLDIENCFTVSVNENDCYVCRGENGFEVYDISLPQNIQNYASWPDSGVVLVCASLGDALYVANKNAGLSIMDISNPWQPTLVNRISTGGFTNGVIVSPDSNYLYVAEFTQGIKVFDLTDPWNPSLINTVSQQPDTGCGAMYPLGNFLFMNFWEGVLQVYDLANPASPERVNRIDTGEELAGVAFSADGSHLFAICGREGLKVYEIYAPDSLIYENTFSVCEDVRGLGIRGNYGYAAAGVEGMFVLDVSNYNYIFKIDSLPANSNILTVNIINDNYIALSDWTEGFTIVDVSNPLNVFTAVHQQSPSVAFCTIWDGFLLYLCDQYDLQIYDLFDYAGVETPDIKSIPLDYVILSPVSPNPFNSEAKIEFKIPFAGVVKLAVYNALGEEVRILCNSHLIAGEYNRILSGDDLTSGIYFIYLQFNGDCQMQKVAFVK